MGFIWFLIGFALGIFVYHRYGDVVEDFLSFRGDE